MSPLTSKNIVLDLDETLVNTREDFDSLKKVNLIDPKIGKSFYSLILPPDYYHVWGIVRPGCKEFLRFCFDYFDKVIVWSAGEDKYVQAVVNRLFDGLPEPDAVLSRPFCETEDGNTTKPLIKLQQIFPDVNLTNTLIVDDREHNFINCNPDNAILIPPFSPSESEVKGDDALCQIMEWLLRPEVKASLDVRTLDKSQIFSQPIPTLPYSTSFCRGMVPTFGSYRGTQTVKE